jgi:hypothetical protein
MTQTVTIEKAANTHAACHIEKVKAEMQNAQDKSTLV